MASVVKDLNEQLIESPEPVGILKWFPIKIPFFFSQYQTYPKSIAFIVSNEFCERFNYYGMRTILVLYMTIKLGYTDDDATVLFHVFTSLVYFFPILGAIIADSYLGKFRTIVYLSCVYAIGSGLIAVGAIPVLNLPATTFTFLGLLLIGIGSGGIKPCVSAFGGDQFKIPEQASQLVTFFSYFYFSINAGSLIATYLMPVLREDVHCFGDFDCFSLAFGVPGVLMVISVLVFVAGKSLYIIKQPTNNVMMDSFKCIIKAISEKSKQTQNQLPHWLDYAEPKFGRKLVADIKSIFKILVLFMPLPLFWALFDQQGSRWTFQATRMDGDLTYFSIKPDQMQVINPLLIMALIPVFEKAIYPFLSKIGFKKPLQKLAAGGIMAGLAFFISGLVELKLEKTYPAFPEPNESQLRIFNGLPCDYSITSSVVNAGGFNLNHKEMKSHYVSTNQNSTSPFTFTPATATCSSFEKDLKLQPGASNSFFLYGNAKSPMIRSYDEKIEKTKSGNPSIRLLTNVDSAKFIMFSHNNGGISKQISTNSTEQFELLPASYTLFADDIKLGSVDVSLGGVYTIVLGKSPNGDFDLQIHVITPPNTVHMLWLIPQFVIMTAGEVMFSVTGLEFAYSQAPSSMKSLVQACWLLTVAFGNIIVVVIAEAKFFKSQAYEFFLFSLMMFIDMAIFIFLAMRYTYVTDNDKTSDEVDAENAIPIDDKRKTFTNNAFSVD